MLAPGHYHTLLKAFFKAGFTVAGLHLTGHGACLEKKLKGLKTVFTFQQLLQEGQAAEQWLHNNGFGPVAAAGHSQGGIFALAHAAHSKSLAAALAVSAVFPQMPEAISLTIFRNFANQRATILKCLVWLAKKFPCMPIPLIFYLNLLRVTAALEKPLHLGKDWGRATYPLAYLVSLFTAELPENLNCPFCLLSAQNDALFTRELINAVFAKINAPAKELIFLQGGGHTAPYNQAFAEFIARTAAAFCANLKFTLNLQDES